MHWQRLLTGILLLGLLWGCALPQVRAEERLFLNVGVEFRGEVRLSVGSQWQSTEVGGLSGLTYDPRQQQFYALSDDRRQPRFYTLEITPETIVPKGVTFLRQPKGEGYPVNTADPEGIALTPEGHLVISSEGVTATASPPWIKEFARENGRRITTFPIPPYYLPHGGQGIRNNLGFEALTLSPAGDRLFVGVESALAQDVRPNLPLYCRLLHYLRGEVAPVLLAEHLYPLDPSGAVFNGLVELLALDNGGHFLSLERSYSPREGYGIQLFEVSLAGATDTLGMATLPADLRTIRPVQKRLVLDFKTLGIPLTNLEGMSFGPPLADGARSLYIIGDNNFDGKTPTQVLIFALTAKP
ncbi:esterase-like activity of phytase family protein [Thermosynechococcus sp.]|uniref:esterase-like activity of phytase family protein n=1 Tax=Thermosynechococcus sp. TaxID=2814275 RepID=UPI00391CD65B